MTLGEEATKTALKARLAKICNVTDDIKKKIKEASEKGQEECIIFVPDENHEDIADWLYEEKIWLVNIPEGDQQYRIIWGKVKEGYISEKT